MAERKASALCYGFVTLCTTVSLLCLIATPALVGAAREDVDCSRRQVFIDTDIGNDFDDSAAILYSMRNFEYQVQFILTATGDVVKRAKVTAKYLELAGLDSVPIGIGETGQRDAGGSPLFSWAENYSLSTYKGGVYQNGIDEMAKRILASPCKEVFILEIAPAPNMVVMLKKYPDVVHKAQVKLMAGSVRRGYNNSTQPAAEYNVLMCPECMKTLFQSGMNITVTPLDSSGTFALTPTQIQQLLVPSAPPTISLMHTFLYWCTVRTCQPNVGSEVWFDAVAAFLVEAHPEELLQIEVLKLSVTSTGYTVIDDKDGTAMYVATGWRPDEGGPHEFGDFYVHTMTGIGQEPLSNDI